MKQNDNIKELFSKKLVNHEASVNPELWNAIASKIGSAPFIGTVAAKGISLSIKTIISVVTLTIVGVTSIYLLQTEKEKSPNPPRIKQGLIESERNETTHTILTNEENKKRVKSPQNTNVYQEEEQNNMTQESVITPDSEKTTSDALMNLTEKNVSEGEEEQMNTFSKTEAIQSSTKMYKEEQTQLSSVSHIEGVEQEIKLPNIVTPNNDGENDLFWINSKNLHDFSITILSDKNKVVFSSSDPDFKWDGKDLFSNLVPAGTYIYFFTAKNQQGKLISKSNKLEVKY